MIAAGTTVDGYRVERVIGRGGMGIVYEAVQMSVRRRVALKVLRPDHASDPAFVERFRREARLQAAIEHPNVLEVYDVGESEQGLYLAMRLVDGHNLLDLLRAGELDAERTLSLLDQAAGALDTAHDAKLVHRDIKPQNVLVDKDDRAFLADFGLTRTGSESTVASSGAMLGTVAYIAPEVVRGEEPTPASDRYSVGATLFHCLTGDVVFPRGSDAAVLYAHAAEVPPRAHERRRELPERLDSVVEAALAKQPEDRPATARAIIEQTRDALGPAAGTIGPPPPTGSIELGPATLPIPPARSTRRPVLRGALAVGALLAAAALGAGAVALSDDDEAAPPSETPVASVPPGAQPLGSDLSIPEQTLDCRGDAPTQRSPACSIVQTGLSKGTFLVPEDGLLVGWGVRGADGEVALDVIRPRGEDTVRVARSQWESAGNPGPHYFETHLPVEAGDQIGVELGSGAAIGVSDFTGATTQRWLRPLGGAYGVPDFAEGTGFDYELALRADLIPGERAETPPHITGSAAASAPDGHVREDASIAIDKPRPVDLRVELVELDDRVALDVLRDGRRTLRVFFADFEPGGVPVELQTFDYPGTTTGEADIWWVNPQSGRALFHYVIFGERSLELVG